MNQRTISRAVDLSFSASDEYLPIAEHGVIGDLHTVALVGTDGTIDWYCPLRFDSPSVFAAILDRRRGGHWRIAPRTAEGTVKQLYFPDTNVLITRFLTPVGVGEVQDFMPVEGATETHRHRLVRRVLCVRGEMQVPVAAEPRLDYAPADHTTSLHRSGAVFDSPDLTLALHSPVPLERTAGGVVGEFALRPGDSASFVLESCMHGDEPTFYSE